MLVILAFATAVLVGCGKTSSEAQVNEPSQDETSATSTAEVTSSDSSAVDPAAQVAGKTWVVLGDSLTEKNFRAKSSYYDYVADDIGCVVVNYGRSDTGYKRAGSFEPFYERVSQMDLTNADCLTVFGSFNDLGKGFDLGTAEDETTDTIGGCMNLTMQRLREANPDMAIGIVTPTHWPTGIGYDSEGKEDNTWKIDGLSKPKFTKLSIPK